MIQSQSTSSNKQLKANLTNVSPYTINQHLKDYLLEDYHQSKERLEASMTLTDKTALLSSQSPTENKTKQSLGFTLREIFLGG